MMAASERQAAFIDERTPIELLQREDEAEQSQLRDDEVSAEIRAFQLRFRRRHIDR
nr:hypothetical protein [Burkholderia contaminans]